MNLDEMIKYIIWIVFLGIALVGLYFLLKNAGIL